MGGQIKGHHLPEGRKTLKKTTLSLLLLIAVMWLTTLTRAQQFAPPTAISVTSTYNYETAEILQKYEEISALSVPERRSFFRTSSAREKSEMSRVYFALRLVALPDLNERQARIMLDAISLSSPEFFAAMDGAPTEKAKANAALQSLARRAHGILSLNQSAGLFANIGVNQAEDQILRKYNDISALPLTKRKALFRNVSSKDKSDLWRTHLALFLARRPELNDWQRETILAAMSLATPRWFEVKSSDPDWKLKVGDLLRSLEARILTAFSLEDGAKIFATLGEPTETARRSPASKRPVLLTSIKNKWANDSRAHRQWTINRFAEQDQGMELEQSPCECSTDSDWCGIFGQCNGTNCKRTQDGCGTLYRYPCNGASCQ